MSTKPKSSKGCPTKYHDDFCDQVYKLCLLGATDVEIAKFFGVVEQTLHNWRKTYPRFLESTLAGKAIADAEVAHSLYKKATGYIGKKTVTATFEGTVSDERVVDDYVGPDTQAASLWLRNRQPAKWRDKTDQSIEHTGAIEHKVISINGR